MSQYVVLTLQAIELRTKHHAQAFELCESLPYAVKGVFRVVCAGTVGPLNVWGHRRDYDAGRQLAYAHDLHHSVI